MSTPGHWLGAFFGGPVSSGEFIARAAPGGVMTSATCAAAALLLCVAAAHAGPCTAQIEQLLRQISRLAPSAVGGPTAPQSLGAQLHHQPTPEAVQSAKNKADADAAAALERARKADADGNAAACTEDLDEARRLYGID
ncbi:MAG TPA: hypothetical protein VJX48_06235 [Xanthobacteraceae bacterium]|nr:hypothetical protein [Xanthobacteraceae bacterium]